MSIRIFGKDFENLVSESAKATKVLNSKLNQVMGKGGILQKLNEAHINALNDLVKNPNDPSKIKRVLDILKREEKVLRICVSGLDEYQKILVLGLSVRFLKKKAVDDIRFLISVIEKLESGIYRLYKRINLERKILEVRAIQITPEKINKIDRMLMEEERAIRSIIRKCKPAKMGEIYTFWLMQVGLKTVKDSLCISKGIGNSVGKSVEFLTYWSISLISAFLLWPSRFLANLAIELSVDDKELQAEIQNLKKIRL